MATRSALSKALGWLARWNPFKKPPNPADEVIRVFEPGQPAFQLRPGEKGISVFQPGLVDPPLTSQEVLQSFRPGSQAILKSVSEIQQKGLQVVTTEGATLLPPRLRQAHTEIRPGEEMTRNQFKNALKELELHAHRQT